MKENMSSNTNGMPEKQVEGKMIFNSDGTCIGWAVSDGSLEYATNTEKKATVIVIRPPTRKDRSL